MKKRVLLLLSAVMLTMALTGCGVEQTNDTITHEAGKELNIDATAHFNVDEKKAAKFEFDTSAVDVNKVGTYEAIATYKNKDFTLTVNVVDTTAPMVEFSSRCVFTNDLVNTDFTNVFEGVYDASEYTTKLIRFEEYGKLEVMDENAVKSLTDKIPVPCDEEELKAIGTENVPTEPGIYRSVVEVKDVHGNSRLEEVYVIYDTTGAKIDDVADKTVRVAKEDIEKEPELDKSDYTITDNVDGKIKSDDIICEVELRDEDKHEWLVHVSYVDRAGNESKADFLITVKETTKKEETTDKKEESNSSSASNTGNATTTTPIVSAGTDPADTDGDGVVTGEERGDYITPDKQAVLDAGYGNVVLLSNGHYGVLTPPDGYVNGVFGMDILHNYLATLGLDGYVSGGHIGGDTDDLWFTASNIRPLITEDDPNFWVN